MQIEIEFRGKRVDTGEWVYGYYAERFNNDHIIYVNEIHNGDNFLAAYPVIPKTVGQYTGLKDMNGKKIYKCEKSYRVDPLAVGDRHEMGG